MSAGGTALPASWARKFLFPAAPDARQLMENALRRAGRSNFSDLSFVRPLGLLLDAYAAEADLSSFGSRAARFDVERCLANLLRLDMAEEENPAIARRAIRAPVFITGMPRSATSFLHAMLSQDPANIVPRCWQLIYPYPRARPLLPIDLRKGRVKMELALFHCMAPGLAPLHHIGADAPQECTDITGQIFQSLRFENTHHIPSYQAWLAQHGHHDAFRFHKRFLQHLDAQNHPEGRRWILKSPDHVLALDAIRAVYPDAKFVFLHRDPLSVLSSCLKLVRELRRPFTRYVDPKAVGRQVSARLLQSADRMMDAAREIPGILHLHYREVVANPAAAMRTLYRHCGLVPGDDAGQRMAAFLARKRHRPGRPGSLAEFGLDAGGLRERFAAYARYFSIPGERSARE